MENPNNTFSTPQADYGSTTSKRTAPNCDDFNRNDDEPSSSLDINETASTSVGFQYQSLPHTNTANLYNRSPSFIRFQGRHSKMTMDKMPNSETRQIVQRIEYILSVLNQVCIGFVTIYMSWLCLRSGLAGTALHAWLVTIGFSLLMAEAIMALYSGNILTFNYKRTTKTTIHWVLQVLGGTFGLTGTLIKLIQKGFLLHSTHGKLGFAAFILCLVSMLSGLCSLYSIRLKKRISPLLNKSAHNILGFVTFVLAMLAQYYGYETGFFSRKVSGDFQSLIKYVTLLSLVLTSIAPIKALYHKTRSIIKHFS